MQDMDATFINGSGTETGQIIATTVGGRNGQPKQAISLSPLCYLHAYQKKICCFVSSVDF